jgi:allantoinase
MPLDSDPVTTSVAALDAKRAAASGRCHVDVGFWGGLVPGNLAEVGPLRAAGVLGFKCFLGETGNDAFPPLTVAQLGAATRVTAPLDVPLVVHAEFTAANDGPGRGGAVRAYEGYLAAHPADLEHAAVAAVIDAAGRTGARVHVAHLSSGDAVSALAAARAAGFRITAETCPHYLTLSAADITDGATGFKVCPPIRAAEHREKLWDALGEGVLDFVVSDHSPGPPAVGHTGGDFAAAFGGIAGLQLSLPLVWTEARRRGFTLVDVARWLAAGPAALAGLDGPGGKGRIAVGYAADFCVFAPDETFVVDPAGQRSRQPTTPYTGRTLHGVVRQTWLRGRPITVGQPHGRLLAHPVA